MGEDRWLCTLLVEKGWRLEYCAVSENTTFCPESFNEFFMQRRRWIPSTLANLCMCVEYGSAIVKNNNAIGWGFILYQVTHFSTSNNCTCTSTCISYATVSVEPALIKQTSARLHWVGFCTVDSVIRSVAEWRARKCLNTVSVWCLCVQIQSSSPCIHSVE